MQPQLSPRIKTYLAFPRCWSGSISDITIIIPTYNEAENVRPLIEELEKTLSDREWQALFVDDNSPDGTADTVERLAEENPRVKCLRRVGVRGLSSACIEGIMASSTPLVAVVDGDRQHDLSILPALIDAVASGDAEIAIGSRYLKSGSMDQWGAHRKTISAVATRMSRRLIPDGLTDPMSGYFVMRRDVFLKLAARLSGKEFKILLDIFASADRPLRFAEVPYVFRPRVAGESKLSTHVVFEFAEMLIEKTVGRYLPAKFLLFVAVGTTGMVVHVITLGVLGQVFGTTFAWAQFTAIILAMTCNYYVNNLVTYREDPLRGLQWFRGLLTFYAACGLGAFVNFTTALYLFDIGVYWIVAGVAGAVLAAVWNYATTRVVTWRRLD